MLSSAFKVTSPLSALLTMARVSGVLSSPSSFANTSSSRGEPEKTENESFAASGSVGAPPELELEDEELLLVDELLVEELLVEELPVDELLEDVEPVLEVDVVELELPLVEEEPEPELLEVVDEFSFSPAL